MWSKQTVSRIQDASIPSPSSLFSCLSFPFNLPPPLSPSLSGPMLTFWLMEKQQLGLRGTDMRLARRLCEQMFHWKHLEVYMGGKPKLLPAAPFSPVPLFSANWSGWLDSHSLRYENPPVWPAPPRWISVLSATSLVEARQTVHETPRASETGYL